MCCVQKLIALKKSLKQWKNGLYPCKRVTECTKRPQTYFFSKFVVFTFSRVFVNLKEIPPKLKYVKKVSNADMDSVSEYNDFISEIGL